MTCVTSRRLDVELVRRGFARSRQQAHDLVASGRVSVAGRGALRPGRAIPTDSDIAVRDTEVVTAYASRAGNKLVGALDAFGDVRVDGRRALDAGASTGGFTDVLLRRGAAAVAAVDVGHGQLAAPLRADPRVRVIERTNVRELRPERLGGSVDLVVADLSFISLTRVLPALARCAHSHADHVLLVKPQFELGPRAAGAGGVVRRPEQRAEAVRRVAAAAATLGLRLYRSAPSVLPGANGNVEAFVWLRAGSGPAAGDSLDAVMDEGEVARHGHGIGT